MGGMYNFMHACKGHNPALSLAMLQTWSDGLCVINNLKVDFSLESIVVAIRMKNKGKELRRESKIQNLKEIWDFRQPGEHYEKSGPEYERTSLPKL